MEKEILKNALIAAMDEAQKETRDAGKARDLIAEKTAQAVNDYIKAVLTKVFSGGPVPQDGGAAILTTAKAQIASLV